MPRPDSCSSHSIMAQQLAELRPALHLRALHLTGDLHQAEDLVQDTFERALRFSSHFERGTNLQAWTYRILFHSFIGGRRKRQREKRALERLRWNVENAAREDGSPLLIGALTPSTASALRSLPKHYRETLERVDLEGLTYRETAEQLGVPVGTVMSRLHRARRLLAARLNDEERVGHRPLAA